MTGLFNFPTPTHSLAPHAYRREVFYTATWVKPLNNGALEVGNLSVGADGDVEVGNT